MKKAIHNKINKALKKGKGFGSISFKDETFEKKRMREFIEAINVHPQIQTLSFENCKLNEDAVKELAKAQHITDLYIPGVGLTNEGAVHIAGMNQLHTLQVCHNEGITEDTIRSFAAIPHLFHLDVSNIPISDYAVEPFLAHETLSIWEGDPGKITAETFIKLEAVTSANMQRITKKFEEGKLREQANGSCVSVQRIGACVMRASHRTPGEDGNFS